VAGFVLDVVGELPHQFSRLAIQRLDQDGQLLAGALLIWRGLTVLRILRG
jgi:hypothetical protein